MKKMRILKQPTHNVVNIIKWFLLATFIGTIVGVLDAVFLKALDSSITWRNKIPYFYLCLPVALYMVAVLSRKVAPAHKDFSTDAVLKTNQCVSAHFIYFYFKRVCAFYPHHSYRGFCR